MIASSADDPCCELLLVGPGSSAHGCGLAAQVLGRVCKAKVRAVTAADLRRHPAQHLEPGRLRLVLMCDGDSSGEIAGLLRARVPDAPVLNIVGMRSKGADRMLRLNLPPAAAGFSLLLLAALGLLHRDAEVDSPDRIEALAALGSHWMARCAAEWHAMGQRDANRVVFVASGELQFLACEAAGNMMEMSEGQVAGVVASPLGLRCELEQLPAATQLVVFRSQDAHARRYEDALLSALNEAGGFAGSLLVLDGWAFGAPWPMPDAWLAAAYALPAQVLALHHAVRLGIEPDRFTGCQEWHPIGAPDWRHDLGGFYGLDRGQLNVLAAA
ncbi:MAG TPA: hypothetical protein VGF27_17465 [Pseudoduganella sp.]